MLWANEESVIQQLEAHGLLIHGGLQVGKFQHVPTRDKPRKKKGWYILHEYPLKEGGSLLTGCYGDYREDNAKGHRIAIDFKAVDTQEKEAIRRKIREDQQEAERQRRYLAAKAARRALLLWENAPLVGNNAYLGKKGVEAHGLRFTEAGDALVPMFDEHGRLAGVQILCAGQTAERLGRNKTYWPSGCAVSGKFHLLGTFGAARHAPDVLLVAEGYATAATLYEATGIATVCAFHAGNLLPVAQALRKHFPRARLLFCADDDYQTHNNPGVLSARQAAYAVSGLVAVPEFAERGDRKWTDFNDLHLAEGSGAVRAQIQKLINQSGWGAEQQAKLDPESGIDCSVEGLIRRFVLILTTETVFDLQTHKIWTLNALRAAAPDSAGLFLKSPRRRVVQDDNIVFDPVGRYVGRNVCNIWSGWPTVPKKGKCMALLELLEYLCSRDFKTCPQLLDWVISWLAYPIQKPGTKLQTALLFHGPQGTGKNTFFAVVKEIYGRYGGYFGQDDLEDKWSDWLSGRLFMIGNEVVGRRELYNVPGKIKAMITEEEHLIRSRFQKVRAEANYTQFVFLSNESTPLVIDNDDRRLCVIHTPPKLGEEFYAEVGEEIANGGVAALHHYLLEWDCRDFNPHSKPPMTEAKQALIEVSADSSESFITEWRDGLLDPMVPLLPVLSDDLYKLYRRWCSRNGYSKPVPLKYLVGKVRMLPGWETKRTTYLCELMRRNGTFIYPDKRPACGPTQSQEQWLGDCVNRFRGASASYCGNNSTEVEEFL